MSEFSESTTTTMTPGRDALITMENNKEIIFKVPTSTARRRRSQKVLDEDTYVEEMGKIIERDFFPDLSRLKTQSEYLEAIERNDVVRIRELYASYNGSSERSSRLPSPATFETPANIHQTQQQEEPPETTIINIESENAKKQSLDQYLSSHTSEDNQSFEEIMDESERKLRIKYSYLYNKEEDAQTDKDHQLALPSIEKQCALPEKNFNIDTWTYKNRNYIMYIPDGVPLTDQELIEKEKRRQEVIHSNTRLSVNPFNDCQSHEAITEVAKKQALVLDGKIGVDGKELVTGTPKVNGFSLVRTPSPFCVVAQSPLMTWGHVEGTPYRLDGSETPGSGQRTPGPAFKMNEPPRREQLAFALAEKANERHRDQKRKAMSAARRTFASPSPYTSSSRDRLSMMSPAARRLTTKKLRLGGSGSSVYTPSPRSSRSLRSLKSDGGVRTPGGNGVLTPKLNLGIRKSGSEDYLTDDLLDIKVPKRQKAADFF